MSDVLIDKKDSSSEDQCFSQVVLQRAIGSVIQTPGRIQIEANTGVFQATLFGDENGNKKVAEFEISALDYQGLLKAIEEDNQLRTKALVDQNLSPLSNHQSQI